MVAKNKPQLGPRDPDARKSQRISVHDMAKYGQPGGPIGSMAAAGIGLEGSVYLANQRAIVDEFHNRLSRIATAHGITIDIYLCQKIAENTARHTPKTFQAVAGRLVYIVEQFPLWQLWQWETALRWDYQTPASLDHTRVTRQGG